MRHGDETARFVRGVNRADNATNAARGVISIPKGSNLRFSQTTASARFSDGLQVPVHLRNMRRIDIINGLKNGSVDPRDIPVNYVEREGYRVIENTRSSTTLYEAGIPEARWNLVNQTGNRAVESRIDSHLETNYLPSTGTNKINLKY